MGGFGIGGDVKTWLVDGGNSGVVKFLCIWNAVFERE